MKSQTKVAYLILLSTFTLSSAATAQRWNTVRQTYTPPRQVERPEPQREQQRYEPETRQFNNSRSESRSDSSVERSNVMVAGSRHITNCNTRPGGVHITPKYFAGHFGRGHGFHFDGWTAGCPTCPFRLFNGEYYFSLSGANFGVISPIPGNWVLATDYLYVDIGDDGNYYLYDAQFPDVAVQLTFVQNLGDDQAGADNDQGDGSDE